ncbi:hypothetical protein [Archangium lipolyticum]|uniref:hypothetical protein n=1 Tax=Archangium lipolyticum TaxID=2970465 RepID=UPI002149C535|nr:hypothetical protein [Archangium lipolyticum]
MNGGTEDGAAGQLGAAPVGTGERDPRWPRRRVLRWALGLVPVTAGAGWAAFEWLGGRRGLVAVESDSEIWADSFTQQVALACFSGHPDAVAGLDRLLQPLTPSRPARLLSACLSMERGDWSRVEWHLAFSNVRDAPEARLLRELARRRPHAPDWRHAFLDTWTALGRPDFRKSTLLPQPLEWNLLLADTAAAWKAATEAQRFPLAVLHPESLMEPRQEWALEQVRVSQSVPLLMVLCQQLHALDAQTPLSQRLRPVVEERLGQLTGSSSRTLQLALLSFLSGRPRTAPFERSDLESLEKLVALPEWKNPSSEEFFLEMRALFEGLLLAPSHHAWLMATLAQGIFLGPWLVQRANASKTHLSEDEQRWLGRLLWDVGARLREQRSDLELDMGLRLQMRGSELTGHTPSREQCIAAWLELGKWEEALKQAAYYRWPLASLQEESCAPRARDEQAWMQAFAGKGELP